MNHFKNAILIGLAFSQIGCVNKKSKEFKTAVVVNYSKGLLYNDVLEFKLDEVSKFSPFTLQYLDDGNRQYLLTDNPNTISIDVYSFADKKLTHRIPVNTSNTLFTNNIYGFWAINKDSIFAYRQFNMSPILITLDGWQVKNRKNIKVINPNKETFFFNHGSMTASPSFIIDNKIHFMELPVGEISKLIGTGYSPEMIYDYQKDTVYTSGMTWPECYDKTWEELFLYFKTYDDQNRVIYSWQSSHDLMVKTEDSIYQVYAKADNFEEQFHYSSDNTIDENLIESNQYDIVLYDKYRKVYYRYADYGVPSLNNDNEPQTYHDQPFSIIILDKDFHKIGETYFPAGKYSKKDSFVGKEGLYISNHNLRNYESLGEDVMSFSLFKLDSQ